MNKILIFIKKHQKIFLYLIILLALLLPTIFKNRAFDAKNQYKVEDKPKTDSQIEKSSSETQEIDEENEAPDINSLEQISNTNLYQVTKVVDGDTIDVEINGKTERLRLIGINTPETVDPRKSVECFGKEASNKAKEMLSGKKVYLESDISQGERDKYGRLLSYVFLEDGTNFNFWMIDNGYAYEYTYNLPYKYQIDFKKAQTDAQNNKIGLWSPDACNVGE